MIKTYIEGFFNPNICFRKYFTEEETVNIVRDIAAALQFLHSKGIAHR